MPSPRWVGAAAVLLGVVVGEGCVPHPEDDVAAIPAPGRAEPAPAAPGIPASAAPAEELGGAAVSPAADDAEDDELPGDDDDDDELPDTAGDDELPGDDDAMITGQLAPADVQLDPGDATTVDEVLPPLDSRPWIRHRRAPRETLEQIAYRYGVSVEDLREWNGISEETVNVKQGRRVRVRPRRRPPVRRRIDYEIRSGDTWASVAVAHGVDDRDVRSYNWPYRGKMAPGNHLVLWVDPIVFDWIEGATVELAPNDGAVRRGAVGIGPPDLGRLLNGVRIPASRAYNLRLPESAYGTTHAVTELVRGFARFEKLSDYDRPLEIGAMSRARGGEIGTHRSHQTGRDVDIRLPRREGVASWRPLTPRRVDWHATWQLVEAFADSEVEVIFLDYEMQRRLHKYAVAAGVDEATRRRLLQFPRGPGAIRGLVRHSTGHVRHIHVRFGCGPYETECVP
jgi:hypothetical protein